MDRHEAMPETTDASWRADLTPEVKHLAELSLSHALESVVAEGGPMTPFAVLEGPDGRVVGRFPGALEQAEQRARAHVRAADVPRAAVAWDGYITVGGVRQDAVFVEASDRGRASVVVAHRYRETVEGTVVVGRPVLVRSGDALL